MASVRQTRERGLWGRLLESMTRRYEVVNYRSEHGRSRTCRVPRRLWQRHSALLSSVYGE